jgi:hypothetical protein
MAIQLADLSLIRRSAAEVCVLRELIAYKRTKRRSSGTQPTLGYLSVVCQMGEEEFREVLGKLAKSGLITNEPQVRDWGGGTR